MTNFFSSHFTLGILGGGQLGKMLLYETRKFDIRTLVLDPGAEAPSRIACDEFTQGDLMDFETVLKFGRKADVLTFEIEGVNVEALEKLEAEGIKVYPSSQTLKRIQDKGVQKDFFSSNNIPTAGYKKYLSKMAFLEGLQKGEISLPLVWKSPRVVMTEKAWR